MTITIVIVFLIGLFLGGFFGMLTLALGVMAKENFKEMPETPISTR